MINSHGDYKFNLFLIKLTRHVILYITIIEILIFHYVKCCFYIRQHFCLFFEKLSHNIYFNIPDVHFTIKTKQNEVIQN